MSQTNNTIAKQRVEDLVKRGCEPEWLAESRLTAYEAYQQTPMPTLRDEGWRRTDVSQLSPEVLVTLDAGKVGNDANNCIDWLQSASNHIKDTAGILSQTVEAPGYLQLSAELVDKGVILCDLPTALEKHADLIRPYLTPSPAWASKDKFALMNNAFFNCGVFLYIPDNVEISLPIFSGIALGDKTGALFPRILVIVGQNSSAKLVNVYSSPLNSTSDGPLSLIAGINEIHVGSGSNLSYLELQQLGGDVACINHNFNQVKRDGMLHSLSVASGGRLTKSEITTILQEPGAASEVLGVVLGQGSEHYNFNTIQEHAAPDTNSDINFRVALNNSSSSMYQGIIRVDKVAQRIAAFQSNKNLLLGNEAKADSIPKMEILADDVKCSHGATVGPVDAEQVFYLNSRGLSIAESQELIVLGFFRQILERISLPGAADWLYAVLSQKLSGQTADLA